MMSLCLIWAIGMKSIDLPLIMISACVYRSWYMQISTYTTCRHVYIYIYICVDLYIHTHDKLVLNTMRDICIIKFQIMPFMSKDCCLCPCMNTKPSWGLPPGHSCLCSQMSDQDMSANGSWMKSRWLECGLYMHQLSSMPDCIIRIMLAWQPKLRTPHSPLSPLSRACHVWI